MSFSKDVQCFPNLSYQTHRKAKNSRLVPLPPMATFQRHSVAPHYLNLHANPKKLRCTNLKTDFLQSKIFINNYFMLQDRKRSTIQFLSSHSQHLRLLHHLLVFFQFTPTATHAEFPSYRCQLH